MQVRSKVMVFVGGHRLRVNPATGLTEPFEHVIKPGGKLPAEYVTADTTHVEKSKTVPGQSGAPLKVGQSQKELRAALTLAGIPFKATMGAADLEKLLICSKKELAPAASAAPSKEDTASNQEVI